MGRPGGDRVHRRPADRRHARSQRLAPGAVHRHQGRPHHHGFGSRRAADSRRSDHHQVALAARQDAAGRSGKGPAHSRRGAQEHAREESSLSRVARPHPDRARGAADLQRRRADLQSRAARSPAGLRLHARRPEDSDDPDGDDRRGSDWLHGQRHADLGAVRQAEASVHLLQAELRAGDQPADRSDPRGTGHEPRLDHRAAAEPVRSGRRFTHQAAGSAPADPDQRQSGKDPRHFGGRRVAFQVDHARRHLAGRDRRRRHGRRDRRFVQQGRRGSARRHQHHHHHRPPRRRRPDSDPVAARLRRRASSSDPRGPAYLGRARGRIRRAARGASLCLPRRLWRRGDQSLSRLRDADRHEGRAAAEARRQGSHQALHQVDRQGTAQGDVQDGHLHLPVLLRRADFRRGRPEVGIRQHLFHRNGHPHRGRRRRTDRRGSRAPPSHGVRRHTDLPHHARRRRRLCVPRARRGSCLERGYGGDAAACGARQLL